MLTADHDYDVATGLHSNISTLWGSSGRSFKCSAFKERGKVVRSV